MKIDNFTHAYHRNGVAGEGFHLCSFSIGRGKNTDYYRAVVFPSPGRCAVFGADLFATMRGDRFEADLRRLINSAEKIK